MFDCNLITSGIIVQECTVFWLIFTVVNFRKWVITVIIILHIDHYENKTV